MGPEEALVQYLLDQPAIADLVSTRVFYNLLPQDTPAPAVVLTRIAGAPLYADDGEAGLDELRIQIDIFGTTASSVKSIARVIRDVMTAGQGLVHDVDFRGIYLTDERDTMEPDAKQPDYWHRTSMDFQVWVES